MGLQGLRSYLLAVWWNSLSLTRKLPAWGLSYPERSFLWWHHARWLCGSLRGKTINRGHLALALDLVTGRRPHWQGASGPGTWLTKRLNCLWWQSLSYHWQCQWSGSVTLVTRSLRLPFALSWWWPTRFWQIGNWLVTLRELSLNSSPLVKSHNGWLEAADMMDEKQYI